jgi:hydroxymethylpyrimidine kinase / phosphomethylpyrimidine kinase / thiamine-phosphate diphosphorylase
MNLTTCITDTHEGAWPILWSIAGTDSGGGAGLAADQRAADACGVHLAPVVAAVTAQNTRAVQRIDVQPLASLGAQMAALADDLPPRVIKTGLLGHADVVIAVARQVDALRERGPVALVVDPVLRASTGAGFADDATLQAYREWLLPRATVLTPNRREAAQLLGRPEPLDAGTLPAMAEALRALGVESVCITGGDSPETGLCHDWIATPEACGWLTAPRVATAHTHGTGCTFASGLASALARGFCAADAAVLAKMLTTDALRRARPIGAGAGPGPVRADGRFVLDPSLLPVLWDERQPPTRAALGLPPLETGVADHAVAWPVPGVPHVPGLYAIVDSSQRAHAVLQAATASAAAAPTLQLRIKAAPGQAPDDAAWHATLALEIRAAKAATDAAGAALYINDHWQLALRLGAPGLHLGQSDLLALSAEERHTLRQAQANGVRLGLSSHSLWELARAAGWRPSYIACGPVWPTTTKDMPWHPQGLGNLAWWVRMAPAPVVAIGGILSGAQMQAAAATGAAGACVVRGLGQEPSRTLPAWLSAWQCGLQNASSPMRRAAPAWPQPCLPSPYVDAVSVPRQPM